MACTDYEVDFLMNYAILDLIQNGVVSVAEQQEEQDIELVASVDKSTLN